VHRVRDPLTKAEVISLKRFSLVFCLVVALSLVFVGSAFANFGPHGGYATDTDSCAGCHRAHTSFSTVEFEPKVPGPGGNVNALLVGSASTMLEFCYACHGDSAPGASTNVQAGVFDGAVSTAGGAAAVPPTSFYVTNSTFNRPLNGGGFDVAANNWNWEVAATPVYDAITSSHSMERTGVLWGAGNGANQSTYLICTSCHDPHGSSNYRLLKDSVNGVATGGYNSINATGGTAPAGWVFSTETGYPQASEGGWKKGPDGAAQMAAYRPDYTGGTAIAAGISATPGASLSAWCSACHTGYNNTSDAPATKNYGSYEATVGAQVRHRHPVDIPLTAGDAIIQTPAMEFVLDKRIPLEATVGAADYRSNNVGCLTCHLAHGSSQDMTGWAAASLVNPTGSLTGWRPVMDGIPGVNPDKADFATATAGTSSLLRADNRGVCERCHNK
jgi:predicted CXXCH cytochrome family protein